MIAKECSSKEEFIAKAKDTYKDYQGLNYLNISANAFFPNQEKRKFYPPIAGFLLERNDISALKIIYAHPVI